MSVTLNSITPPSSACGAARRAIRCAGARRQLGAVDGLGRVLQQVQQHLLDEDGVDHASSGRRCAT
jgi:hypothetical protein